MSRFTFFNPNPTQRYRKNGNPMSWTKGDCAVRAMCAALGIEWKDAFSMMCGRAQDTYDMPNSDEVIDWMLESNGFVRVGFKRGETKPTINDFAIMNPKGVFVLRMSGHIVTVKDGRILDTWDCGEWKVSSYYKKLD